MFGGLEIKGDSKEKQIESVEQKTVPAENEATPNENNLISSAFSFIATTDAPPAEPTTVPPPSLVTNNESNSNNLQLSELLSLGPYAEDTSHKTQESGFSFMANMSIEQPRESNDIASADIPSESSAFSFLNSGDNKPPAENHESSGFSFISSAQVKSNENIHEENVQQEASGFSFLSENKPTVTEKSQNTYQIPSLPQTTHSTSATNVAPVEQSSLTAFVQDQSSLKPEIKTATAKKNIKKTRRGKKVGVHANEPTEKPIPPPPPPQQYVEPESVPVQEPSVSPEETKHKAEEAMRRAEQFIKEKETSQQSPYTENDSGRISPTVAQAEAAAAEAKNLRNSNSSRGFDEGVKKVTKFFNETGNRFQFFKKDKPNSKSTSTPTPSQWTSESVQDASSHSGDSYNDSSSRNMRRSNNESEEEYEEEYEDNAKDVAIAEERRFQRIRQEHEEAERKKKEEEERIRLEEERRIREEEIRRLEEEERIRNQTPQEKLNDILANFQSDISKTMDEISLFRSERIKLEEEKATASKKFNLASQFLTQTMTQQANAVEAEDFELADRLADVMSKYEHEKNEQEKKLHNVKKSMNDIDERHKNGLKNILDCFNEMIGKLEEFYEVQDKKGMGDSTDILEKFATTFKRLSAEQERLNNELKHIERDEGIVKEERKELEELIGAETQHIDEDRTKAKEKLLTVDEEIQKLKEQLSMKEAEHSLLTNELSILDGEIEQIRSKFSRQVTRVTKKETSIADNRNEWEVEQSSLTEARERHEAEVEAHSESLLAYENMMKGIKREVGVVKVWMDVIETDIVSESSFSGTNEDGESENGGALEDLNNELLKCEAAVKDAEETLHSADDALQNLKDEINSIEDKIPALESTKKAAASKRDFKSAAKASKEIKELIARKERFSQELNGEALDRREQASQNKNSLMEKLENLKQQTLDMERDHAVKRMIQLGTKIKKLKGVMLELKEENSKVAEVGISVLENEVNALKQEGSLCGAKFGGWDEILETGEMLNDLKEDNEKGSSGENEFTIEESEEPENESESPPEKESEEIMITPEGREEILNKITIKQEEIEHLETKVEAAVEEDDYDLAAELDETINVIKAEIVELEAKIN